MSLVCRPSVLITPTHQAGSLIALLGRVVVRLAQAVERACVEALDRALAGLVDVVADRGRGDPSVFQAHRTQRLG